MIKILSSLIFFFTFSISVFSSGIESNYQKIFSIDSPVYRAIRDLYISDGLALPSTSGPWSGAELNLMLSRIDAASLTGNEKVLYDYALSEVTPHQRFKPNEIFGFSISIDLNAELYLHANPKDFTAPEEYGTKNGRRWGDYNQPTPLLSIPFETWIGENVYGYTSLNLGSVRNVHNFTNPILDEMGNVIGYSYEGIPIMHNLVFVSPLAFSDFDMNFPLRAFGSVGGDWWNISIGRDKMSWGPGETGNFVIGEQIPYHNNARVSFFTDSFKYIFSMSAFVHPLNYMMKEDTDGKWYYSPTYLQNAEREGLRMFIAHRLEWRIFNRINMALTEGIMYQNAGGNLDPLVISPTAIFHNFYIRGNANSILSLELDASLVDHWNFYFQFVLDELQMAGELTNEGTAPSALGFMLGTRFAYPMRKGSLYGSIETAYTDPYLYLRDYGTNYQGDKYGNNFIVAFPEFVSDDSSGRKLGAYTLDYLGYRYGGDAFVLNFNTGYEEYEKWYVEGNLMYMLHGAFDMLTRWGTGNSVNFPTSSEPDGSYDKSPSTKNSPIHYVILTAEGGFSPIRNLDLYGRMDFVTCRNKGNMKSDTTLDIQFTVGIGYKI